MNFWTDTFTKLDLADRIKFRIQQKVLQLEHIFSNTQQINTKNNYSQHGYCCKRGWTLKPRLFALLYFGSVRRISIGFLLLTSTLQSQLGISIELTL